MVNNYTKIISNLKGLKLLSYTRFSDSTRIIFDKGWEMIIYNPYSIEKNGIDISLEDNELLKGNSIVDYSYTSDEIIFTLNAGIIIHVNLRENAFVGPEAMQVITPEGKIIVWN